MIRFNCTKCKQRYKSEDDLAGDEIDCQKCGTTVSIPNVPPPAAKIGLQLKRTGEPAKLGGLKVPTLTLPHAVRPSMLPQGAK